MRDNADYYELVASAAHPRTCSYIPPPWPSG